MQWALSLGSKVISTRFVSVTVEGSTQELLPVVPPVIRVEVRHQDRAISLPVSASYGFQEATKDVRLEEDPSAPQSIARNTITLMLTETPDAQEVAVCLIDATTGMVLARLENVPLAIAI